MLTSISDAGMITVLGLILGAMMAIDMGGPINKAAYVFGSGMLATASQMMAQGVQASDPAVQACYGNGFHHGRWYGATGWYCSSLQIVPSEIYKSGAGFRSFEYCNGMLVYYRRRNPICGI